MVHSSEPSPVLFPCRLKYRYEATNTLRDFTTALSVSHQPEAGIRLYKRLARMLPFLFPACISVCLHAAGSGVSAHTEAVHDPGSIACAVSASLAQHYGVLVPNIFGVTMRACRVGVARWHRPGFGQVSRKDALPRPVISTVGVVPRRWAFDTALPLAFLPSV